MAAPGEPHRLRALIRTLEASHSYGLVLVLVVFTFVFEQAAPDANWSRLATVVLSGATLLLTLWTSRVHRHIQRVARLAVAIGVVASTVAMLGGGGAVASGSVRLISALLVVFTPLVIARGVYQSIRARGAVTLQAVFGVISIYLLLGMLFAFIDGAVAGIGADFFFSNGMDGTAQDHLYFSFCTLTTVGYGDLAPATNLGRTLAVLEALIGQIYLVTVLAVIVSNLRPVSGRGRGSDERA